MPAKPKSFAPMAAETVRFAVMSQCLRVPVFQAAIKLFFWLFHRLRRGPGRPPHRRAGGRRGGSAREKTGEERSALRGISCGIKTTTEVVVCMSPRRARYRQNPSRGIEVLFMHYAPCRL